MQALLLTIVSVFAWTANAVVLGYGANNGSLRSNGSESGEVIPYNGTLEADNICAAGLVCLATLVGQCRPMANNTPDTPRSIVTQSRVARYHMDGYLVLRASEWLSPLEQSSLELWLLEVQNWPEKRYQWMKYFEKSSRDNSTLLNRVENFLPYHQGLRELFLGPKVMALIEQLLGSTAVLYKDKLNMKLPGGGGFEPHQDMAAGWSSYGNGRMEFVTHSVSMDHAHEKNGALQFVAGRHTAGLFAGSWEPMPPKLVEEMAWDLVEARPGDLILFGAYTPHRSGPNRHTHARRNFYLTYNKLSDGDHRAQYFIDKRRGYPPEIERDPAKTYTYRI
eukprot:TRINITY_DN22034_c0_g1_i1.p1 TRINITY_DN22034_c0_g1~~TRINITY_DN22034_c0_g1_i1.p1  ORF type:complete len:335 (-),score=57.32 TRINITY_DN22034_c0_g1_i1:369-1373(-)